MTEALAHRGPDAAGVSIPVAGVALAHRRLAIVDLTAAGAQPMPSASGRWVITYNGELYNTKELRHALGDVRWRGHSDTEVLVEAIDRWGLRAALERVHGMFALAVWDQATRTISLARDRAGEKPLYYGRIGETLAFASELKPLRRVPGWRGDLDLHAVALFMQHSYIPPPNTIYRGIHKLPPGTFVTYAVDQLPRGELPPPTEYWSLREVIIRARESPIKNMTSAVDELHEVLADSVNRQCVADVPLGAFLSGGIDSSTIVALMQQQGSSSVQTFTVGFTEPAYDESAYAREVAQRLGTQHTELLVTPAEAMAVVPDLPKIYDEPFADSSQVPMVLVSRLARRHVKVALSGDGGDELFGGYQRHLLAERLSRTVAWLPATSRRAMANALRAIPAARWQRTYNALSPMAPARFRNLRWDDRIERLIRLLPAQTFEDVYRHLISHWTSSIVSNGGPARMKLPSAADGTVLRPDEWMMRVDFETYLSGDILVKVDRAAMSVGLETRVPLLDPRVIELAWRLPRHLKVRRNEGKLVLRKVLSRYLPEALFQRAKAGFGIPLGAWLKGPLREWAEDLLSPSSIRETGVLEETPIREHWTEHLSGRRNWQFHLWDALMLQAWLRAYRSST